jgi:predicted dehydrogenase
MARQSRREFLEDSMFAAAAAVSASAVPGMARAADKSAEAAPSSPNETLGIAVVGVNGRGGEHLSGFLGRKGCEVVAICDCDETVGQKKGVDRVEKQSGRKPAFYQDLRRVLEDKSVDVVTIATPNHWHSLAAIWALQAGKDVYVEKPVSHNVSEGRRVVEAARKYNRLCQTGTQCRSMGGSIEAIEYIHAGKIGEVKLARGLCYKGRGSIGPKGVYDVPAGIDYDIWCGPAPKHELTRKQFHYDWHWQWDYGNGDLGNQGIHQMDIARWGLGVNDVGQGILSYGGRLGYEDAGETANTQVSIHNYGDKTLVFEVRGLRTDALKGAKVGVIFYGSDGYVVLTSYDSGAAFGLDGTMVKEFKGGGDHFANFVGAVRSRNNAELNADILEGHLSSALCHLGNISYRLGEKLTPGEVKERLQHVGSKAEALETFDRFTQHLTDNQVDLGSAKLHFGPYLTLDSKMEQFVGEGSQAANPMLTREYRAPYLVPAAGAV